MLTQGGAAAVLTRAKPEGLSVLTDVASIAVLGVDLDQGLDVPVFLQLPERLNEPVSHLFRDETSSHAVSVPQRGYGSSMGL
jgi:hypothetical protein